MNTGNHNQPKIICEASENTSFGLTAGLGFQLAVLTIALPILMPTVIVRAADGSEAFAQWASFAAVAICGITTALQSIRKGFFGSGHILVMGTAGAYISVCISAISWGGVALLSSLVLVSGLMQLAFASRLHSFRHFLTPTVTGTVVMLIPVTVMPALFDMLEDVPDGSSAMAAPMSALTTFLAMVGLSMVSSVYLRLWAPAIGVVLGTAVAAFLGAYDTGLVTAAAWFGFPQYPFPGLRMDFGPSFWALLPAFLLISVVTSVRTVTSYAVVQSFSWRRPRAIDYRAAQGAAIVDGIGNAVAGIAGTVPSTAYSVATPVIQFTRVASRKIGMATGAIFLLLALFPKGLAVVLAIPGPIVAAYLTVLMSVLFFNGMKMVLQDGENPTRGLIAGVSFWIGVGFQGELIFPEYLSEFAGGILSNGMTSGGIAVILGTLCMELIRPRSKRLAVPFNLGSMANISEFLNDLSRQSKLDNKHAQRLRTAAEASLSQLLENAHEVSNSTTETLRIAVRIRGGEALLEFTAPVGRQNLQDKWNSLEDSESDGSDAKYCSLESLRNLATSLSHKQYFGLDVVSVNVDLR